MEGKKSRGRKLGCVICNSITLVVKHINRALDGCAWRNEDAVTMAMRRMAEGANRIQP